MHAAHPARVEGVLDAGLSRWLWLVKWLLVLPHVIVLAFLWLAYGVLSLIALFGILFTGRYPRSIFDFNVGVLRWTWRVAFYAYGALGTDRYPPFTLAERPDYPATLAVDYPARLSRGLVLVKWWLLAIPHYLLLGLFLGGGWFAWESDAGRWSAGTGLIGLLVLFAGVALLFRGRYPGGIFDLVLGLDRWVVRVAAYVGLMTDVYPPFRLDPGAHEPGQRPLETPAGAVVAEERGSGGWGVGRVLLVVVGSLAVLSAAGMIVGGIVGVVIDRTQRDEAGFVMSGFDSLATDTYALVSDPARIEGDGADWFLGQVRIRARSERPVFLGLGARADVDRYLAGVARSVVTGGVGLPGDERYRERAGGAPATAPANQDFWVESVVGDGEQALDWTVEDGEWRVVAMNADGAAGVSVDVGIGAELDALLWLSIGAIALGGLVLLLGLALVFAAIPRSAAR